MFPDFTTPPEEDAHDVDSASGLPAWTTGQRLGEGLPDWCRWTTLADVSLPHDGRAADEGGNNPASWNDAIEGSARPRPDTRPAGTSMRISRDGYGAADNPTSL